MIPNLTTTSTAYICLHEAGHAAATYLVGGTVEFIELMPEARTNANRPPAGVRTIACAGFAMEFILYRDKRLVQADGLPITEKSFIDAAMNSTMLDKSSYFGSNLMQSDGTWPEHMDREFMNFAIRHVVPLMDELLPKIVELALALEAGGRLERSEIERILRFSTGDA